MFSQAMATAMGGHDAEVAAEFGVWARIPAEDFLAGRLTPGARLTPRAANESRDPEDGQEPEQALVDLLAPPATGASCRIERAMAMSEGFCTGFLEHPDPGNRRNLTVHIVNSWYFHEGGFARPDHWESGNDNDRQVVTDHHRERCPALVGQ